MDKKLFLGLMATVLSLMVSAQKTGDKVEVIWASEWYPATIIELKDLKYRITYEGYNTLWDEWVSAEKIRKR